MHRCRLAAFFFLVFTISLQIQAQQVDSTIPSEPTGLKIVSLEKFRCTLTWNAVSGSGVNYIIYRKSRNSGEYNSLDTVTLTTFCDTTILARNSYSYKITACNTNGESVASDILWLNTYSPYIPINKLWLKSVETTSCIIAWNITISLSKIGIFDVKYVIFRDGIIIDTVSSTEYRDTTVTVNKHYLYHISYFNVFGESSSKKRGPLLVSTFPVKPMPTSPNGFVVWSEGSGCDRELKYQIIIKDKGPEGVIKTVVKKGEGADIQAVISYDGEWIAFARSINRFKSKYGECDYHRFDMFDVYIAKIDYGKSLPARPIKIGHGYLPSWGDDAKIPLKPKTLYYTKYSDQTIQKVTVQPDGSFTPPVEHAQCPKKVSGTSAHTQIAPNGKYIAFRPANLQIFSITSGDLIQFETGIGGRSHIGGEYPSWGPKSHYLLSAPNKVVIIKNGKPKLLGNAGLGKNHFGFSNDADYYQGILWIIGRISGRGKNGGGKIEYKPVDISNDGWRVGNGIQITEEGTWCDIHTFYHGTEVSPNGKLIKPNNKVPFNVRVSSTARGVQLVIESNDLTGSAELFDLQGKRRSSIEFLNTSKVIFPLNRIAQGMYILQVHTHKKSTQRTIWILK